MRKRQARKPYRIDDPDIVEKFKAHLLEGWSPVSFAGKLQGGHTAYFDLLATNHIVAFINNEFQNKRTKWGGAFR